MSALAPVDAASKAEPTQCQKCGGDRVWRRRGTVNGIMMYRAHCLQCHRDGLARDRAKHGGAAARNRIWESQNREKALAHRKVESHLKLGNIRKKPCERCGSLNVHAHHDDYSVPLDVMWLCPMHHVERHRELESIRAENSPDLMDSPAGPTSSPAHPGTNHESDGPKSRPGDAAASLTQQSSSPRQERPSAQERSSDRSGGQFGDAPKPAHIKRADGGADITMKHEGIQT